jgi:3-dehydroquinate synthase
MPTTVLAQNDAGVGVKNGINGYGRKNFFGTFAPPFAVINDFDFLNSLSPRDLRAGIVEAVKVALIQDQAFFNDLYRERQQLAVFAPDVMENMIVRCAALHIKHIGTQGDPFETGSARPLDFGHWSAHKLEELTENAINHGEAVAVGLALDSLYSFHKGLIRKTELDRILTLLEDLRLALYHPALRELDVKGALEDFQEHLGGDLTITLPVGIGRKKEVHDIDERLMYRCIGMLEERWDELHAHEKNRESAAHPVLRLAVAPGSCRPFSVCSVNPGAGSS